MYGGPLTMKAKFLGSMPRTGAPTENLILTWMLCRMETIGDSFQDGPNAHSLKFPCYSLIGPKKFPDT